MLIRQFFKYTIEFHFIFNCLLQLILKSFKSNFKSNFLIATVFTKMYSFLN